MAQYIEVSGASFGNGHSDNPTYSFSVGTGDIYLSGSGGWVNSPTGISKATLTAGVKLKVTDNTIQYVTCSVDSGFTCTNTISYASWTPISPTPTVTPSSTPPNVSKLSLQVEETVPATNVTYRLTYNINGFKASNFTAVGNAGVQEIDLFITGTPNGTGTMTVTRILPDGSADAAGYVVATALGCNVSPTGNQSFTNGETVSETFSITNFSHGDSIGVYVLEGNPP